MIKRQLFSPHVLAALVAALVGAIGAGTASAASQQAPAAGCSPSPLVQPFLPWADSGFYALAPGGSFEADMSGWSLDDAAAVVEGNETSYVNDAGDSHSLSLPRGSSATSQLVCVTSASPDLRLFTANQGASSSKLKIDVQYTKPNGQEKTAKVAELRSGSSWTLSPEVFFLDRLEPLLKKNGVAWVRFNFTAVGGDWQIDDLYIDPLKMQ